MHRESRQQEGGSGQRQFAKFKHDNPKVLASVNAKRRWEATGGATLIPPRNPTAPEIGKTPVETSPTAGQKEKFGSAADASRNSLLRPDKNYGNRRPYLNGCPCGRQLSGPHIDLEHDDTVRILICRKQPAPAGIETETPGNLALSRSVPDPGELAGFAVDRVGHDGVMSPIRTV